MIQSCNVFPENCVCQCYDAASVMSGGCSVVQARFKCRYVFVRLREENERSQAALQTAIVNAMFSEGNNSGNGAFNGLSLSITS